MTEYFLLGERVRDPQGNLGVIQNRKPRMHGRQVRYRYLIQWDKGALNWNAHSKVAPMVAAYRRAEP